MLQYTFFLLPPTSLLEDATTKGKDAPERSEGAISEIESTPGKGDSVPCTFPKCSPTGHSIFSTNLPTSVFLFYRRTPTLLGFKVVFFVSHASSDALRMAISVSWCTMYYFNNYGLPWTFVQTFRVPRE